MKAKLRSKSLVIFLSLCLFIMASSLPSLIYAQGTENDIHYRQLTLDVYKDKVEGGWLGQAIAVLWAQWT